MARPSKVDRLPPEIRDAIGDLRRRGRTIDEILAHLKALGGEAAAVSRSGLGAHLKKWDALADRLRGSREAAEASRARVENDGADDRMARLNVQMLHSAILGLWNGEDGEALQLDAKEAMMLSTALKNLVSASRTDQIRWAETKRLLEEERAKTERLSKVADEALQAAAKSGMSSDIVARFRADLGIDKGAS